MKTNKTIFLTCALLIASFSSAFAQSHELTILHINDLHGNIKALPKIAKLVKDIAAENKKHARDTIFLLGGDMISGTPVSTHYKGGAEFAILSKAGALANVIGNHEFDFGLKALTKNIKDASFDTLSANIFYKDSDETLTKAVKTTSLDNGEKLAVIGLTGKNVRKLTTPSGVADLTFKDQYKIAGKELAKLDGKFPIVIALTHEGVNADVKLAQKFPEFDVVIGGHDHVKPAEHCRLAGKAPVCQAPANGKYLGRLDLTFENGDLKSTAQSLIEISDKLDGDKSIQAMVDKFMAPIDKEMKKVVAIAATDLVHKRELNQTTPLGFHVAKSMALSVGADIGLMNSGGIRRSLKKGPITRGDIEEVLPFQNSIVKFEMKGSDILAFLKLTSGKKINMQVWPHFDELNIAPSKKYTVAVSSYYAEGGDGLKTFSKLKELERTDEMLAGAFTDYARKEKILR